MRNWVINILLVMIILLIIVTMNWRIWDKCLEVVYDWRNENPLVRSKAEIDLHLSRFDQLRYGELETAYLRYSKSNIPQYKKLVEGLQYFKLRRSDLNKRIVGPYRLKDFVCKDDYYKACLFDQEKELVAIFNPKIFYKTLELIEALEAQGYDQYAFFIVNGHRHPKYNEVVGGAKLSRHIKGEAVDIQVKDINRDGKTSPKDKEIVLEILENQIIGDEGGIGLYPGTDNIHYDVRGVRARWDSY